MRKTLFGLVGLCGILFALPAMATLPAGYTELEYIESTGTQYIKTSLKASDGDVTVVAKWTPTNFDNLSQYACVFGANSNFQAGYNSSGTANIGNASSSGRFFYLDTPVNIMAVLSTDASRGTYYVGGTDTGLKRASSVSFTYIFAAYNSGSVSYYATGKLYKFYAIRSNAKIMNLVPAQNSSGVVGMYDTVTNTFFTNSGTGEFIAGPIAGIKIATTKMVDDEFAVAEANLAATVQTIESVVSRTISQTGQIQVLQDTKQTRPDETCPPYRQCLLVEDEQDVPHWYVIIDPFRDFAAPIIANNVAPISTTSDVGYTQLEYIASSGSQYIDTGIAVNTLTTPTIETEFTTTDSGDRDFFGTTANSPETILYNVAMSGGNLYIRWGSTSGRSFSGTTSFLNFTNGFHKLKITGTTTAEIYVDNVKQLTATSGFSGFSNTQTINIFRGRNNPSNAKFKSFTITNANTILFNGIPARRNTDNKIGMYDTVSGRFFENAGSGTFTAGPAVANTDIPAIPTWSATWATDATKGVVAGNAYGEGLCNATSETTIGAIATAIQLSNTNWATDGSHCWCRITGIKVDGTHSIANTQNWVKATTFSSQVNCDTDCASSCSNYISTETAFRSAMLNI
ncbi:MAG: hypothetical protein KBT14_02305 [Proteobacteria bacterium]|nr:hypothetical protein [Candidatus Enterousia onthequi]